MQILFYEKGLNKYIVLYNLGFNNFDPIPDLAQLGSISIFSP